MGEQAFRFLIRIAGLDGRGGWHHHGSDGGDSTVVVTRDVDLESYYNASRNNSAASDAGGVDKGVELHTTVTEIDCIGLPIQGGGGSESLRSPSSVYELASPVKSKMDW